MESQEERLTTLGEAEGCPNLRSPSRFGGPCEAGVFGLLMLYALGVVEGDFRVGLRRRITVSDGFSKARSIA